MESIRFEALGPSMHREISHTRQPFAGESNFSLYALTGLLGLIIAADLWPVAAAWLSAAGWSVPIWPNEFYPGYRIALIAAVLGGARVLYSSIEGLLAGRIGADLAIAIACLAAILTRKPLVAAEVVFIGMVGECLEAFTFDRAQKAIRNFVHIFPHRCWVCRDGQEVRIHAHDVQPGDHVIVKAGARVPVDGRVIEGRSTVDAGALTGESMPVDKGPGDEVLAGSLNQFGVLHVHAVRVAEHTIAGQVIEMTARSLAQKSEIERTADRLARYFLPVVLGLAALTLVGGTLIGLCGFGRITRTWSEALAWSIDPTLAVLVVACPCALILATPATVIAALGRLAGTGILIKGSPALERLATVNTLAFDKTGTLTEGRMVLGDIKPMGGHHADFILATAAKVEQASEHPLARLIVDAARERQLAIEPAGHCQVQPGAGVATTDGSGAIAVGTGRWFRDQGIAISQEAESLAGTLAGAGQTPVLVARNGAVIGVIGARDCVRPEARGIIAELRSLGIGRISLLTGDRVAVAQTVAREAGIDLVHAELLPDQKAAWIAEERRTAGRHVGMIGDGINDAPALAGADVGLAIGGAEVDLVAEAGDIVLMGEPLRMLPFLVRLSRECVRIIRQNIIGFAFGVNIIGIVLTGWIWPLLSVDPAWHDQAPLAGVVYHQLGSLAVLLNAMRLLWFERAGSKKLAAARSWLHRTDAWLDHYLDPHRLGHWFADHRRRLQIGAGLLAFLLYLASGLLVVQSDEVVIVRRFGRQLTPEMGPGWYWTWPWPIDEAVRLRPDQVRTIALGYRLEPDGGKGSLAWESTHDGDGTARRPEEAVMLTGDGNLVEIQATVAYTVDRAHLADYLFSAPDAEGILRADAESVLRQAVATRPFLSMLTKSRGALEDDVLARLTERCQAYGNNCLGVRVTAVTLHDLHPPREVVPAYHDVAKAMENRDRQINEAQAESIRQHREALSKGKQLVYEAEADSRARVRLAESEADVFLSRLRARRDEPDDGTGVSWSPGFSRLKPGLQQAAVKHDSTHVAAISALTDFRLFWDALAQALAGRDKIIIDADGVPGRRNLLLLDPESWRIPSLLPTRPGTRKTPAPPARPSSSPGRASPPRPDDEEAPDT
jgi:Cu+-exporting ATPase